MTTLYRKYRPQKLDELDLTDVRESLTRIVKSGKIPHAFLFAGPKGSGKTSAARILAKIINCQAKPDPALQDGGLPCDKCEQCISITKGNNLDVVELDAASHRGIDDIRTLRDAVKLAPAKARKKVYIIDEAHMLTLEASNALLKTLEEPPEHVMFILATTNPEKLTETIKSRTTNILFKKAKPMELVRSLGRAVKGERVRIKKDALGAIAKTADGSFRDAVKILEQLVLEKRSLEREKVEEFLFQRKVFDVEKLMDLLAKKDTKSLLSEIERINGAGGSMESLIEAILVRLRSALLTKVGIADEDLPDFDRNELVYLIELFSKASREIADSPIEELPLEIAIIEWGERFKNQSLSAHSVQNSSPLGTDLASSRSRGPLKGASTLDSASQGLTRTVEHEIRAQTTVSGKVDEGLADEIWAKILVTLKPINTTIEALLRAARPLSYDGKNLTLGVFYRFHKERLEEGTNRRILEEVVATVLGNPVKVICTLTEPPKKEVTPKSVLTEGADKDIIKIAEEIFGQ